jgi:hypothetical protein
MACTIDLRGHGEHSLPLDQNVLNDVEIALDYCRSYGKVTTIGHSLGGRLALLSKSDFTIAISPALDQVYSEQTKKIIRDVRGYGANESPMGIFEVMKQLPMYHYDENRPARIIFGSRDVPEIVKSCLLLKADGMPVRESENGLHSDTYLLKSTFDEVKKSLRNWYLQ